MQKLNLKKHKVHIARYTSLIILMIFRVKIETWKIKIIERKNNDKISDKMMSETNSTITFDVKIKPDFFCTI